MEPMGGMSPYGQYPPEQTPPPPGYEAGFPGYSAGGMEMKPGCPCGRNRRGRKDACSCSCGDCECADDGDFAGEGHFNGAPFAFNIRDNEMRRMAKAAKKEESSRGRSRGRRKSKSGKDPKGGGPIGGGGYPGVQDEDESSEDLEARIRRLERAAGMPDQAGGGMAGLNRTGSLNGMNGMGAVNDVNGMDGINGYSMNGMYGLDGMSRMNRMNGMNRMYSRHEQGLGGMGSNWSMAGQSGFEDDYEMDSGVGMGMNGMGSGMRRRRRRPAYASSFEDTGADGWGGSGRMKRSGLGVGAIRPRASGRVRFERPEESLRGGLDVGGEDDPDEGWEDIGDGQ